ncbi:MAG TPA: hypothetical protein VJN21_14250 [Candidatus Acidoferrales bacterium]|nr:hypothetical protein [Candidatus Acidoferrales bacterium]
MPLKSNVSLTILASCLFAAPAFAGYEYPLPSPEIRNAYFLGRGTDSRAAEFLATYKHWFTPPQTYRYLITEVEVLTPYAQVVQRGEDNIPNDSEVQTETDLRAHPLRFLVKVSITFNAAIVYDATEENGAPDGGRTFSAELAQAHKIEPVRTEVEPIYEKHGPGGIIMTLDADPTKITSAPLHITVRTPDGKSLSAEFDLSKLK